MLKRLRSYTPQLWRRQRGHNSGIAGDVTGNEHSAWILHYASAPIIGGVESIMSDHARLLRSHGCRVSLVAGRGTPELLLPEIDSRHPMVLEVQAELDAGRIPEKFETLRARIRQALAERLSDADALDNTVVFAHNVFTLHKNLALTAALVDLANEGWAKFVAWSHDLAWTNPLYLPVLHDGWPWNLLRTPCPGVTYVAISKERQVQLAKLFGWPESNVRCIPNGIDPVRFFSASSQMRTLIDNLNWWERDVVLLAPVRMTRRKNLELAIRVVAELKASGLRPLLLVTGPPGPHNPRQDYADFLNKERSRLQLEDDVCFLSQTSWLPGGVSGNLVAELFSWADALLFPSLQEGFGLPMLEAGLARLPIFCADLPVLRETGGADVTYFSPMISPALLAEQIRDALAAPGAASLRRRVLRENNWEGIYRTGLLPLLRIEGNVYDEREQRIIVA